MLATYTHFLSRDPLYAEEKPYSLRFTPPEGFPRANTKLERHGIKVANIRPHKDRLSFEKDGCAVLAVDSQMSYDDFDDEEKLKSVYLREIADSVKDHLGAQHVQVFEHTVRKRHEIFPISTGEPYQYNQPTSIAHVDTTVPWCLDMARHLNPNNEAMLKYRIRCVNVWKPITGPVKDWPLALCHPRSLNAGKQLEPCDLVYPDYVVENQQVYHSKELEWFYLENQMPNEAWIFLQADTDPSGIPVAHTAFPIETQAEDIPRESIEVRTLVYYGGFD